MTNICMYYFSPEAQGAVCATIFLFVMFCFTFVPFHEHLTQRGTVEFPFNKVCTLFYLLASSSAIT